MDNYDVIFRAYDIRGKYNVELTNKFAYIFGRGLGSYIKENTSNTSIVVGYDNRLSSPILNENVIRGLVESGMDVISLGMITTPMYYYSKDYLNIGPGIMITASHNASDDNGFKFSISSKGNAKGEEIQEVKEYIKKGVFKSGNGNISYYDIKEKYIDLIISNIKLKERKKIVFDCGSGTGSIIIKDILDKLNVEYFPLCCESDGTFPIHHPDPQVNSNLKLLQDKVLELGYDMGISIDADGDRVRVVDNKGNILDTEVYMDIMLRYLNKDIVNRKVLFDVKCSKTLLDVLDELDIEKIMYRTGPSYIYRKIHEDSILYALEYSGHIWLGDRFKGFDDGIYNGLRMLEVISNSDDTLDMLASKSSKYFQTEEIKIKTTEHGKVYIVDKVKEYVIGKGYKYNDIDGVRVEFNDGWALVRYSNTGPNVTCRYEASSERRLREIEKEFSGEIEKYKKEI